MEKNKVSKTLLWLDDFRNPYQGSWLYEFAPEYVGKWPVVWVKTYEEFIEWINQNGLPRMIAFDHDLGELNGEVVKSGYDAAKWVVGYCLDDGLEMCKWVVQSSNPVGVNNINGLLMNYVKYFGQ